MRIRKIDIRGVIYNLITYSEYNKSKFSNFYR